jgi:N-acetylglutamate synthase-like GNAT family acetyltransferase
MIHNISIKDINKYFIEAKKSGLIFCNSTSLYGLYIENELVAFTGIIITKNKAIFKNHFVPKKYRGKGYFKILFQFSINLVKKLHIKTIEATCTKMSIHEYLKFGFKPIKQYKLYTKVRYENL